MGEWVFDPAATRIDPFCIRPTVHEVSALYVRNGTHVYGPFFGDVTLAAGDRIALNLLSAEQTLNCLENPPGLTGTEVIISAAGERGEESDRRIRTINGGKPDRDGNISLIGRSCLEITGGTSSVLFDDTCAQPCCTCKELTPILQKITELASSLENLDSRITALTLQAELLAQSLTLMK